MTLRTIIQAGQLVKNFTAGEYRGLMTVREAIYRSQNVPAVKVLTLITPQVGFNYLEKFGISTLVSPQKAINGSPRYCSAARPRWYDTGCYQY